MPPPSNGADWACPALDAVQPGDATLICADPEHPVTMALVAALIARDTAVGILHPFCAVTVGKLLEELVFARSVWQVAQLQALLRRPLAGCFAGTGAARHEIWVTGARAPVWMCETLTLASGQPPRRLYTGSQFPVALDLQKGDPAAADLWQLQDAAGQTCALGQVGRVCVRAGLESEWFVTPDWGASELCPETGRQVLRLLGHADSVIDCERGVLLPVEAEEVLEGHPAVAAAALVVIDPQQAEELELVNGPEPVFVAAVELRESVPVAHVSPLLEVELLDECHASLSARKCPRAIVFIAELPRQSGGRVNASALRAEILQDFSSATDSPASTDQ